MEQKLGEAIQKKPGMASSDNSIWDEVDRVVLTPEEELAALRAAKSRKLTHQKEKAYWENINKPIVYPTPDAAELKVFILNKMKSFIPDFIIDNQNRYIIDMLCLYFVGDPSFEDTEEQYSLNKGIALIGPVGCGKTTILRAFAVNPKNPYIMVSARKMVDEFSSTSQDKKNPEGGSNIIKIYSGVREVNPREYWGNKQVGLAVDDLGTESIAKYWGNERNVLEEVISNRYENYLLKGKTHLTTNLSAEEIEDFYGRRVRSRFREMFNMFTFDPKAPDRRK